MITLNTSCTQLLSYVPLVSFGLGLHELIPNYQHTETQPTTRPYGLLDKGSLIRTILLFIPLLGNLTIAIYDIAKHFAIKKVSENGLSIHTLHPIFKDSYDVVVAAIENNERAFLYASEALKIALQAEIDEIPPNTPLSHFPNWMRNMRKVVTSALAKDENALQYASPRLRTALESEITQAIITVTVSVPEHGLALANLPDWMKNIRRIALAAIENNENALQYASPDLRMALESEVTQAITTMSSNAGTLANLPRWMKNIKRIVLAAILADAAAFQHASEFLKSDHGFVLYLIKNVTPRIFTHLNDDLKNDDQIACAAVTRDSSLFPELPQNLQRDCNLVSHLIKNVTPWIFIHLNDDLKNNKQIALATITCNYLLFSQLPQNLQRDRNFVLYLIKNVTSWIFIHLNDDLKNDKQIALATITCNYLLFSKLPQNLQGDRDFVLYLIKNVSPWIFENLNDDLKNDKQIAFAAVARDPLLFPELPQNLQRDRDFVLQLINTVTPMIFEYLNDDLKNDREVVQATVTRAQELGYELPPELQRAMLNNSV